MTSVCEPRLLTVSAGRQVFGFLSCAVASGLIRPITASIQRQVSARRRLDLSRGASFRTSEPCARQQSRRSPIPARESGAVLQVGAAFANSVETELAHGTWTDPDRGSISVAEWARVWLKSKVDLRASSRTRLDSIIRTHVLPEFGDYALNRVGNSDVRTWVASMVAFGYSPATVRKSFHALSQMMRAAVSDRRIIFMPCQDVPLPAERQEEQRFLNTEEVEHLAASIDPRFRALILLATYGGLRFGELAGLRRSRVDLLRGRVIVAETLVEVDGALTFGTSKTKQSRRRVPLPRQIVTELEDHLAEHVLPGPDALVFTGPKGAPPSPYRLQPILVAAGPRTNRPWDFEVPRAPAHFRCPLGGSGSKPERGLDTCRTLVGGVHFGSLRPSLPGRRIRDSRPPGSPACFPDSPAGFSRGFAIRRIGWKPFAVQNGPLTCSLRECPRQDSNLRHTV